MKKKKLDRLNELREVYLKLRKKITEEEEKGDLPDELMDSFRDLLKAKGDEIVKVVVEE